MAQSTSTAFQVPTVSSIPALHAFDSRTTTWQSYRDRINFYFKANRINQYEDKEAIFLWSVGDTTYNLLESLVSPDSLTSEGIEFAHLIKLLDSHYDDTENIMTSTYDFYSCYQKPDQTFAEWKAELCEKMRHCGFTTSSLKKKPQDRALRDMYVIGIKSPKIRQALLKEQDPDLETTERIIQLAERLAEDVRHFDSSNNRADFTVAKVYPKQPRHRSQSPNDPQPTVDYKSCQTCGATNHLRSECKYRDFICNFCKRSGHLKRVCRQKKAGRQMTKQIKTSKKVKHVNQRQQSTSGPTMISLPVNGHYYTFELDTGTYNTIINVKDWQKIGSPIIRPSTLKLKAYNDIPLKVKGQCNVNVDYQSQTFNLTMIVVHGAGSPLLGLQWITAMEIDLNDIIHGLNYIQPVAKIYDQIKHITSTPSHSVSNELAKRFISSFKERVVHEQQAGQTNKGTAFKSSLRRYRRTSHPSSGICSTDILLQRPIQTGFIQLKPDQSILHSKTTKYSIGQLVWSRDYRPNKQSHWQPAIITKIIGSMLYEIQLTNGQLWKRHQNQIRPRYSKNIQSSDVDRLSDDKSNTKLQLKTIQRSHLSPPWYPRRIRKPPECCTPS